MAVQRSLGWATTKKSITMTGQAKRKASLVQHQKSCDSDPDSDTETRKNSCDLNGSIDIPIDTLVLDETANPYVEDLKRYSARKFSFFFPIQSKNIERTILDDIEYFMSKKECDYGMCECCSSEKKQSTNWESIEQIIENDPEIIFDSDDNPILVEPVKGTSLTGNGVSADKRMHLENNVAKVFRTIGTKLADGS